MFNLEWPNEWSLYFVIGQENAEITVRIIIQLQISL